MIVSIPSFRDPSIVWTVQDCIDKADDKDTLVIVVCEQNMDEESCLVLVEYAESVGTRLIVDRVDAMHAQGPCWARRRIELQIQSLWEKTLMHDPRHADECVLMVDAHTLFAQHWDTIAKQQLRMHPTNAILTCYPRPFKSAGQGAKPLWNPDKRLLYMDMNGFEENGIYLFKYAFLPHSYNDEEIMRGQNFIASKGLGACMLLFRIQVIYEVPYLEHVPYLFIGEETLMWCRYFQAGYDLFVPLQDIVQTTFSRQGRANFHAMSKRERRQREIQARSIAKVKKYLQMGHHNGLLTDDEWHSFYTVNKPKLQVRTVQDFLQMTRFMQRTRNMITWKQMIQSMPKLNKGLLSFIQ